MVQNLRPVLSSEWLELTSHKSEFYTICAPDTPLSYPDVAGQPSLLGFPTPTGGADVVEGDGAGSEEDERECEGSQSQGKFVSTVARQAVVEVHFGNGDAEIDANGKGGYPREQTQQDEQSAEELGKSGEISGPARETEAGNELNMVVKAAENFVVPVNRHDGAQGEAHDEKREGLQTIEKAQAIPPGKR
jgi:hypothetical protein